MSESGAKVALCAVRTAGLLALVALTWTGARYVGWTYEDTRTVLGIITNFLPEAVLLLGIAGGAFVFYRMDADEKSDFEFAALFKAGSPYDIDRFVRFWLLIICSWVVFVLAWRDKPLEAVLGIIIGAFLLKAGSDSWAKAMGKQPEEGK